MEVIQAIPEVAGSHPVTSSTCMVGTADAPEWVAADVCEVLGIRNSSMAVAKFPQNCVRINSIDTNAGTREMLTVTEAGLYSQQIQRAYVLHTPFEIGGRRSYQYCWYESWGESDGQGCVYYTHPWRTAGHADSEGYSYCLYPLWTAGNAETVEVIPVHFQNLQVV